MGSETDRLSTTLGQQTMITTLSDSVYYDGSAAAAPAAVGLPSPADAIQSLPAHTASRQAVPSPSGRRSNSFSDQWIGTACFCAFVLAMAVVVLAGLAAVIAHFADVSGAGGAPNSPRRGYSSLQKEVSSEPGKKLLPLGEHLRNLITPSEAMAMEEERTVQKRPAAADMLRRRRPGATRMTWMERVAYGVRGDAGGNSSTALEIDIDRIYTPWGRWSKCRWRRGCKQVRKRLCTVPPLCGKGVLKQERPCRGGGGGRRMGGKCSRRKRKKRKKFHIVKRKKLSRRTRDRLTSNKAFYTPWSKWSKCSENCKSTRIRDCRFKMMCGSSRVYEEAYCYTDGSLCHQLFRAGKSLAHVERYRNGDGDAAGDEDVRGDGANNVGQQAGGEFSPLAGGAAGLPGGGGRAKLTSEYARCGVRREEAGGDADGAAGGYGGDGFHPGKTSPPTWALRIMGGREAIRGNWPWQVAILNKHREVFCGGTLVAPGWILTAAHCVKKVLYVRLGEHDLVINEGTEREFFVEESVHHPEYDPNLVDNDVALLRIPDEGWPARDQPNAACLPDPGRALPPPGTKCTIIGWGKEKISHVYGTDVLHEAQIPVVSKDQCLGMDYIITDNMFCAGYRGGGIDSCAGDSGGPLLCDVGGQWTIFGVTSFGEECGRAGKFGIYAKVPNFVHWIDSVINDKPYQR